MSNEQFWAWVESEMEFRGLSYYRIEKMAGLSNATISKPARNWSSPTLTICKAIAFAFNMSVEKVLREAGHLPKISESRRLEFNEIAQQLAELPDGPIRDQVMAAIRALAADARRRALEEQETRERKLER